MHRVTLITLLVAAGCGCGSGKAADDPWPPRSLDLQLAAPIGSWDEAIPLGNGLMGGLLWGEKDTIHLGLDRGDLWDERTYGPKQWWKSQTWVKGGGMWEVPTRALALPSCRQAAWRSFCRRLVEGRRV